MTHSQFSGIRSRHMTQQKLFVDSVRLGENDLRDDPDCQAVNKWKFTFV